MYSKPLVKNWAVYGMNESIRASKYPMAIDVEQCTDKPTERTHKLAECPTGTGHDQFLTGIVVQFDLTFSIKAWVEAERYHFFDFVSSQSTMHRVTAYNIKAQCNEYVDPRTIAVVDELVEAYNQSKSIDDYLRVLYNIPVGFRLTARMTTNYRQLKTIYQQRKNHRLPEWREFCAWIRTLPHSELIMGRNELNDEGRNAEGIRSWSNAHSGAGDGGKAV